MHDRASAGRPTLVRALGPLTATAVIVGTVIGAGIFKKPQVIAASVPSFHWILLVWVLGGVLTLMGALAVAEVAVLFPQAGGNYVYLREGYGRWAGFLWGWTDFWIIRAGSIAALATIFTESFHDLLRACTAGEVLSPAGQRLLTVLLIIGLALVNTRGVRWSGWLQLAITAMKVACLLAIVLLPFVGGLSEPTLHHARSAGSEPHVFRWGGLGTALLAVLWSYHGWMNLSPVAGEVRKPRRNIPVAFVAGVGIIIALYLGVSVAYHAVIPQAEMAGLVNTTVAAEFSRRLLGPIGEGVAAAMVMCSVCGALNGNLLAGPRLLYAMGEDGLAPRGLGAVHARYHTPALAILALAGWAVLLVLAVAYLTDARIIDQRKSYFDTLTDFAMFGAVIFETMGVTTIFCFRRRFPNVQRPYRCWGYPLVPILYLILPALILGNMFINQRAEVVGGLAFLTLGALIYAIFLRKRKRSIPANVVGG